MKYHIKTKIYNNSKIKITVSLSYRTIGHIIFYDINKPASYILYLNVNNKYNNKGIGTFLVKEVIKQSINSGCISVSLYVAIDNDRAIRLYSKLGFFISLFSPRNKSSKDHYLMTLKL